MRKFMNFVLPTALALLAGCSAISPYERPAPPIAAQWPQPGNPVDARPVAGLSWQQFLPDPRLQALIAAALEHNRDLALAVGRVEEARALYGITRADRLPTLNLAGAEAITHTPGDLSASGQGLTAQRFDANLAVTAYELDFWGRVKSLNEAARAGFLATEEARKTIRITVIADVANAYFTWLEMEQRSTLARASVETRKETRHLVKKRRDVGLAGDLDYLAADGAYESAQAELANLERNRAAAENALVLLVGAEPKNLPAGLPLATQGVVPNLAIEIPSETLLRRPDVRAAEARLIAANANIGAARAAFLPRIGISLALGLAGSSLSGLFDGGSGAWSFVPSLALPLFDGGRNQANLDLSEARKVIAVAEYEKTLQQAFREVADGLAAREKFAVQIKAQEAGEAIYNQRLRLVEARYKAGASSYLEVLDAQRDTFAAQQGTAQVRRALLGAAVQLYKALGGGQQTSPN